VEEGFLDSFDLSITSPGTSGEEMERFGKLGRGK